jgi:hypothetical protein
MYRWLVYRWPSLAELTRKDVATLLGAFVLVSVVLVAGLIWTTRRWSGEVPTNLGFGSEWECTFSIGRGGSPPRCFRVPAAESEATTTANPPEGGQP